MTVLLILALVSPVLGVLPWQLNYCIGANIALGCGDVTQHKAFVGCNTTANPNVCYCLPSFAGNATLSNPCQCPPGKQIYFPAHVVNIDDWALEDPICIDLPTLLALQQNETLNQLHISYASQFLNNTIGITPSIILASQGASLTGILDPNVRSRISPAGTFDGFQGVVEYFYGFVANPALQVVNVDFRTITARDYHVGVKANLWLNTLNPQATGGHPPAVWNLTTFAFFTFNPANDKILSIDVSVPNLGILLDIPANETVIRQNNIISVCGVMTQTVPNTPFVNGTCYSQQTWGTFAESALTKLNRCIAFMNSIPWGTNYRDNSNTYSCRQLHVALTLFNPVLHCPHTSPSGGGACIDFTYESYYLVDY